MQTLTTAPASAPDHVDPPQLSALVYAKLGNACWERFNQFLAWPDQWDGHQSRRVPLMVLCHFETFLEHLRLPFARPASLFLLEDGGLEILLRDSGKRRLDVALRSDRIEFAFEPDQTEGDVAPAELPAVTERLNQLLRA